MIDEEFFLISQSKIIRVYKKIFKRLQLGDDYTAHYLLDILKSIYLLEYQKIL